MIGTSRTALYLIRICICGLRLIAPLCVAYCGSATALYTLNVTKYRLPLPLEFVAVIETLFYFLVYTPYRTYLQREAIHPPPRPRQQRRELFDLCNKNIPDPEAYLQQWFLGAPAEEIKIDNVKEFFLWAFFDRAGPPGDDDEELEEYIRITERLLGRPLESGRGTAQCLRLTLDKVNMQHRSLTWYSMVGFVDFLTYIRFQSHGFHFHRLPISRFFTLFPLRLVALFTTHKSPVKHITYWHRPHTSPTKLPIVFIHGIGIGLYPYLNFFKELNSTAGVESTDPNDQVGIIALEIMPVSFRITHEAVRKEEMCAEINQIITKEFGKDQKFVLISHSYGTVITTHLLHTPSISPRIGPIVLIDPVSILLHQPDVAYNFTRRQPRRANEHQLYYFASMDMGVSHTLSRHFFWSENILWREDLAGRKVTVSLGGKDLIVNTEAVGRYLTEKDSGDGGPEAADDEWKNSSWKGEGIDVLWFKDLDHAQVFDKPGSRMRLLDTVRAYCEQS